MRADAWFHRFWYEGESPPWWTRILSLFFAVIVHIRLALYRVGLLPQYEADVPVVVIGNLVVGGAGKTPLAVALVIELQQRGYRVGIVSRGYGAHPGKQPLFVNTDSPVEQVGDEPLLLARRTGAPVCVHPRRARAARTLTESEQVDLLLCDDGLQHYALSRDMEIAVVDGARGLGNGRLLPAGPLREPASHLARAGYVVINGAMAGRAQATLPKGINAATTMNLIPGAMVNLRTGERRAPDALSHVPVAAIAGIGNPQRFFETLGNLGYTAECRAFPDHHVYVAADFEYANGRPLLMTEKDAVKCVALATDDWWYLETAAELEPEFVAKFIAQVEKLTGRAGGVVK